MPINSLIILLNFFNPISLSLAAHIRGRVTTERLKKGHTLSSPRTRKHSIWYIASGLAKEYYIDESGKMVITAFWKENELMVDANHFFGKKGSDKYIELVEDSTLLMLTSTQAHELQDLHPEVGRLGYCILFEAKGKDDQRSKLLGLNATESNKEFCEMFPSLRISIKDAASYLGLSRKTITISRSKL